MGDSLIVISERESIDPKSFTAALLMMPKSLEGHFKDWNDGFAVDNKYSAFEITLSWGWTRATRHIGPVTPHPKTILLDAPSKDDFNPVRHFGYTPKPWGDQRGLYENVRASIRILTISRGHRTSEHLHMLRNETFYCLQGKLRVQLWDNPIDLEPDDSVRVPAGTRHTLIALATKLETS